MYFRGEGRLSHRRLTGAIAVRLPQNFHPFV